MKIIQTKTCTEPDGLFALNVASGMPSTDVDVIVIMQPTELNGAGSVKDPESWEKFVDETSGSIADPTFERHAQNMYTQRESRT
jgi:hypothetical protein